jgi:hypothetical protein
VALHENGLPSEVARKAAGLSNRDVMIFALLALGLTLIFDILFWSERGGILSIWPAVAAVHSQVASIEVDKACLRVPIMAAICVVFCGACVPFSGRMQSRNAGIIVLVAVIGPGFVLDAVFGPRIIEQFMEGHEYSRCPAHDVVVGNGKGRVWFNDYASSSGSCTSLRVGAVTVIKLER